MSIYQIIYLVLLLTTFIYSVISYKATSNLRVLPVLFGAGILAEAIVNILYYGYGLNYHLVYHIYVPLEYCLLTYFFYLSNTSKRVRLYIISSIPIYAIMVAILHLEWYVIEDYPGWIYNLGGIFLIVWSLITLFSIEPVGQVSMVKLPLFWICLGIVVFYTGIFFFNGVYNYLITQDRNLSENLLNFINKGFNYLLYICFIIGFLCSNRMKNYL